MIVTADQINDYSRSIKEIQRGASNLMYETLEPVWGMDGARLKSSLERSVRETAPSIARRYAQAAGEVSAELWEDIYGSDTGEREEALLPDIFLLQSLSVLPVLLSHVPHKQDLFLTVYILPNLMD